MNKIYRLVILLVSLINILCTPTTCIEANPSKKSTCHDKTVANSGEYCCYYKAKANGVTGTTCFELTKDQKENIKDYIDMVEKAGVSVKSLDCKSSFIEFGLLSLIFLLL
jgi:hypothetical protein